MLFDDYARTRKLDMTRNEDLTLTFSRLYEDPSSGSRYKVMNGESTGSGAWVRGGSKKVAGFACSSCASPLSLPRAIQVGFSD